MKKAILTLILFLAVGLTLSAQNYTIVRHAVGTGGFIDKTTQAGKMSGLFGQAMTGKLQPYIDGGQHTMYIGFWSPPFFDSTGIVEAPLLHRGIYNYPNPVSGITNFKFSLSEPSFVTIRVYNTLGALVAVVSDSELRSEGENSIEWNIRNSNVDVLSSDSYLYEMMATPVNIFSKANSVSYRNIMMIAK